MIIPQTVQKNHIEMPNDLQNQEKLNKYIFEPERILIFDLIGANAHFQNIQTNSSSLTYFFPPPTTIYGLIAGIIGIQRDKYYNDFSEENTFLALDILTPLRKEIFTVNYRIYNENGYAQIPFEILFPVQNSEIKYRIYFSIRNLEIYDRIREILKKKECIYPPYLGITEMIGQLEYHGEAFIKKFMENKEVKLNSIFCPEDFKLLKISDEVVLYPEYMRTSFEENRVPGNLKKYFYIAKGEIRINASKSKNLYEISFNDKKKIISRL
ncbi:MAG: type I-B CRISPR-associated protein Cas5b [Promethearchaeota archaeon]